MNKNLHPHVNKIDTHVAFFASLFFFLGCLLITVKALSAEGDSSTYNPLVLQDVLRIQNAEDYQLTTDGQIQKWQLMGNKPGYSYELLLNPELISSKKYKNIQGHLQCSDSVSVLFRGLLAPQITGKDISFSLYDRSQQLDKDQRVIAVDPFVKSCDLKLQVTDYYNKISYLGVRLVQEFSHFAFLPSLTYRKENCNYVGTPLTGENIFFSNSYQNITCAMNADSIETLETPESGFKAKVETLLGQAIPEDFITNANPEAALDFSKAPKFKAIFLASLVYRSDFYGSVMSRLLKFHADRGTLVYIIVTGYMQSDEDHRRLQKLSRDNPNIRLQEYQYHAVRGGIHALGEKINELHRDMHIKMFVTLSDHADAENVVVTGGRNIHDGFLFDSKPDYARSPLIAMYAKENFVHWSDFEIKVTSRSTAETMFAHLLTFWNRETQSEKINFIDSKQGLLPNAVLQTQMNKTIDIEKNSLNFSTPLLRHVISIPFNDEEALEQIYVDMIDQAQNTIQFSSPYLRPTQKIANALMRAIQRNVAVTIQTRINLEGDTLPWLYSEMNKGSINQFYDKVELYEWKEKSILHSKFILIDGRFGFIGSVNVSQRSFIHDIESGFIIYNPEFIQHMAKIFVGYNQKSKRIVEEQKRNYLVVLLLKIIGDDKF